jgi:glycine oxidase
VPLFNSAPNPRQVLIIGAGSFGLATAACLRLAGHKVTVVAPDDMTAASLAAGMIAPAMESAVDGLSEDVAGVLKRSRALWAAFAAEAGIDLQLMPAEWRGEGAQQLAQAMTLNGLDHVYDADHQVLTTSEDAKLDPVAALEAMGQGIERLHEKAIEIRSSGQGWLVRTESRERVADDLVIATGAAASIHGVPDEAMALIDALVPIRGLIGITRARLSDHVVRGPGAYVAPVNAGPWAGGSVIGATMEVGVRELGPDLELCEKMLAAAFKILGQEPSPIEVHWRAGIRAASPDGLPMAGPIAPGLHLALAPRRNGWLLAPLVGAQVLAGIEGRPLLEPTLSPLRLV